MSESGDESGVSHTRLTWVSQGVSHPRTGVNTRYLRVKRHMTHCGMRATRYVVRT